MKKLTKQQGIILTGFTGRLCCTFADFHEDAERRLGRTIEEDEYHNKEFAEKLQTMYVQDFLAIMPEES